MKRTLLPLAIVIISLTSCSLGMNDQNMLDMTLPRTYSPSELVGEWASDYTSLGEVIDAYEGRSIGNTWLSGRYFKITDDGRNSEYYFMTKSQYTSAATKAVGTVRFDVGSTSDSGSFTFLALKAHYKGWGSAQIDRDANETELKNNLTSKYYYRLEKGVLVIEAGNQPGAYSSAFKRL
jgi:hypothetical protein